MPVAERIQRVEHYALSRVAKGFGIFDVQEPEICSAIGVGSDMVERQASSTTIASLETQQEKARAVRSVAMLLNGPVRTFQRELKP